MRHNRRYKGCRGRRPVDRETSEAEGEVKEREIGDIAQTARQTTKRQETRHSSWREGGGSLTFVLLRLDYMCPFF